MIEDLRSINFDFDAADTPAPDAVRRPVTMREIADRLCLDKETVRRQFHILVAKRRIAKTGAGYLASIEFLQSAELRKCALTMAAAFYRMIYDLTALRVRLLDVQAAAPAGPR